MSPLRKSRRLNRTNSHNMSSDNSNDDINAISNTNQPTPAMVMPATVIIPTQEEFERREKKHYLEVCQVVDALRKQMETDKQQMETDKQQNEIDKKNLQDQLDDIKRQLQSMIRKCDECNDDNDRLICPKCSNKLVKNGLDRMKQTVTDAAEKVRLEYDTPPSSPHTSTETIPNSS